MRFNLIHLINLIFVILFANLIILLINLKPHKYIADKFQSTHFSEIYIRSFLESFFTRERNIFRTMDYFFCNKIQKNTLFFHNILDDYNIVFRL